MPSPRLSLWQPTFFTSDSGPVVCVDVLGTHKAAVHELLPTFRLPAIVAIDLPRNSLGSTKGAPRVCFHLHFEGTLGALVLEMLLIWLRKALQSFGALVGHIGSVSSETAMLLDCPSPEAAHTHGGLCWSMIVLSPKLVLLETRTGAETWPSDMTMAWSQDPRTAGEKVRCRTSQNPRATFAQVAATSDQLAAARTRRSDPPSLGDPTTLRASISLQVGTTGPISQWLPAFMSKTSEVCGLRLSMAGDDGGIDIGQWRAVVDYEGCWTGRVLVQLQSVNEVLTLRRQLHGQGVRIQHHVAGIEVDSLHVDLHGAASQRPR